MTVPTPLVPVRLVVEGRPRRVLLKLEGAGPDGSIKRRTVAALLADLAPGSKLERWWSTSRSTTSCRRRYRAEAGR